MSWNELTDLETRTLELVAQGYSNKEIARRESKTVHAVKRQLDNIYQKLGVSRQPEVENEFNCRCRAVYLGRRRGAISL